MAGSYRTVIPGITLLCSLVAFIIALCCLLAGTNPSTLKNMALYNLNTSMVGPTLLKDMNLPPPDPSLNVSSLFKRDVTTTLNNAASQLDNAGKSAASGASHAVQSGTANLQQEVDEAKQEVKDAAQKAEDATKNAASTIVSTFINTTIDGFDIQGFYTAHLLTYCEGEYTTHGKQNITYCSNGKPNHMHNATTNHDSSPLSIIKNLHLPDPVGLGMSAITLISKIIAAFYIFGIIATFTLVVTSTVSLVMLLRSSASRGKALLLHLASLAFGGIAFVCFLLATAMTHFMVNRICNFFNHHPKLGVAATKGTDFDRCSWVTVVLMGIAVGGCVADVAIGVIGQRRKEPVLDPRTKFVEMEEE